MTSNSPNTYYIKELNPDIIAPSTYSLTQPDNFWLSKKLLGKPWGGEILNHSRTSL